MPARITCTLDTFFFSKSPLLWTHLPNDDHIVTLVLPERMDPQLVGTDADSEGEWTVNWMLFRDGTRPEAMFEIG